MVVSLNNTKNAKMIQKIKGKDQENDEFGKHDERVDGELINL